MATTRAFERSIRTCIGLAVLSTALACTPRDRGPSPADRVSTDPNQALGTTGDNTLNNAVIQGADANGIVTYDGYQTIVARNGDTVQSVAERIDLSATQLGAYNGLPAGHQLRPGDELVLPPRPGGYGSGDARASVITPANPDPAFPTPSTSTIEQTPLNPGASAQDVAADAPSVTGTDQATAQATPEGQGTGWSPDIAAAAIDRSSGINDDGSLGAPPSSGSPVPPEPESKPQLRSPDLGQYQTQESVEPDPQPTEVPGADDAQDLAAADPAATGINVRMQRPVQGPVAIGFNKGAGPTRNDGVDFAAPAGASVVAAADGEVALVSQSLGGLGTIVLVRHQQELLTVYGRIDGVLVNKGDIVRAGQQIGVVSNATAPAEPRMHFEVRRGSESLDPMQFL